MKKKVISQPAPISTARQKEILKVATDIINNKANGVVLICKVSDNGATTKVDDLVHICEVSRRFLASIVSEHLEIGPAELFAIQLMRGAA